MSLSEREQGLVLDLLKGRVTEGDFLRQFPATKERAALLGLEVLRQALDSRDPTGVEFGLYLAFHFGISMDYLPVLTEVALEDWHESHEDVVEALTELKAPASADVLYRTALAEHEYLDYDEAHALGVKSVWALAKLQTRESIERLGDLLRSPVSIVASNARDQLVRIEASEVSPDLREVARRALEIR